MRVFLDTNVLVSAYAARGLCADAMRVVLAEHELIVGQVVLEELERILAGKLHLTPEVVQDIIISLREHPVQPKPESAGPIPVRDPDDAWVLASAMEARADVLVTGDSHLLEIASEVQDLRIASPRGFWELLRNP